MKNVPNDIKDCPIFKAMVIFNSKWNMWVIYALEDEKTMRFGEIKKRIPDISNNILSSTLKGLEKLGLITKKQYNEVPPHTEYSLTKKAIALKPIFKEMWKWGEKYNK
ncbi:MAG: helix-turn-helix transcriptional regulator [Lachnospiraceae bacterium]|nr:helix-turn-helix transcriptional regulator [Lachnospiraceae bacterium]